MSLLKLGAAAEPFAAPDLDGQPVMFDPAGAGPKVLVFYKVTCPTCQLGMPYFDRLYRSFAGADIPFYAVVQDPPEAALAFADEYGITMPQLIDAKPYPASNAYKLTNVPTLFVVDGQARIELVSPAFVKSDIEKAAELLARSEGVAVPAIFTPEDDAPALRPG
jgi:peroxiredoxin